MAQIIMLLEAEGYNPEALQHLKKLGQVVFYNSLKARNDCASVRVLVVRLAYHLNSQFLQQFPNLHTIATPTTGLNHLDLGYCQQNQIEVISLRKEFAFLKTITATAELAFALMLGLVRNIPASLDSVSKEHLWNRQAFRGRELSQLVLGLLGFGRLGQQMAAYASAFNMKVLATDPFVASTIFEQHPVIACSQEELFRQSDVISVHVDFREENRHLIAAEQFGLMHKGSYFINTARGELVDEAALLEALSSGQLAGAALDVLEDEQNLENLFQKSLIRYAENHKNLLITPHIGGCTLDSMHKAEMFIVQKLKERLQTHHANR